MKLSFFAFLVCAFHKEPIELSDFDPLHLNIYLEFYKAVKATDRLVKDLQNKINFTKKCFAAPYTLKCLNLIHFNSISSLLWKRKGNFLLRKFMK